jgi:hypothetical protein
MTDTARSMTWLAVCGFFAVLAVLLWFFFVRPVPSQWLTGTIASKTFKPAGTYWQYPPGIRQGFRTANAIPIAESFVFEIEVPELPGPAFLGLNVVASEGFGVGQRVRIEVIERNVPGVWRRVYVLDMKPE